MDPSPQLLLKLDRPGPRYTSYPTVPSWEEGFPQGSLDEALGGIDRPADIYAHIPFCREQCWFCGCNQVVSARQGAGDRYLDALEREIASLPLPSQRIRAARIHLGGGTPNWLSPEQIARLYAMLFERFSPIDGAELSIEIDPDMITDEQLALLCSLGITRVSVGVQSTDPRVLTAINRPQRLESVRRVMDLARARGMRGINVDLVYGLPYQTQRSFASTIEDVLSLAPDRLAVYSYAHVPWMKAHQQKIDPAALPDRVEKMSLFLLARDALLGAGYLAVGMDHFALPGDALAKAAEAHTLHRNFMGYTTQGGLPLIGLGVSAITELDSVYAQAEVHLGSWYRAIERGSAPKITKGIRLSADDQVRRDVISSLMCNFEVSKADIESQHGVQFDNYFAAALAALEEVASDGLCAIHPDRIEVTDLGRLLVRNVAMAFDNRLGAGSFSRTV